MRVTDLLPHLTPVLLQEAAARMRTIEDNLDRSSALIELIPHLGLQERNNTLREARAGGAKRKGRRQQGSGSGGPTSPDDRHFVTRGLRSSTDDR